MANDLIVHPGLLPTIRTGKVKLSGDMARHSKYTQEIAELARRAMEEVTSITAYGRRQAENMLMSAEMRRQTAQARGLPFIDEATYEHLTQDYLLALSQITNSASAKILFAVDQLDDEESESFADRVWEFVLGSD